MATLQIKNPGSEPLILKRRQYRVRIRNQWNFHDVEAFWTPVDYLEAINVRESAGPSTSSAQLLFRHGKIKREDSDEFVEVFPESLCGKFVQIILLADTRIDRFGNRQVFAESVLFTGYIPTTDHQLFGVQIDASGNPTHGIPGDQTVGARGLEYFLDTQILNTAWVQNQNIGGTPFEIDTVPIFNATDRYGLTQAGNRSQNKWGVPEGIDNAVTAVFADLTSAGQPPKLWSVYDILEYLLLRVNKTPIQFSISSDAAVRLALEKTTPLRLNLAGLSITDALNKLLDRRRGFGWTLRVSAGVDESKPIANIHIFSVVDAAMSVADVTIPGATEIADLRIDQKRTLGEAIVGFDTATRYGRIIVRGQPLVSMFTLAVADGNLQPAWTANDENTYKAGAGSTDKTANDRVRRDIGLRHVYTRFRVPRTWDFTVKDGVGGAVAGITVQSVAREFEDDGTLKETNAPQRDWGRTFLEQLPILRNVGDGTDQRDFERPFALIRTNTPLPVASPSNWELTDRLAKSPMDLHILDRGLGVELGAADNHILALNHWSGAQPTGTDPLYDYANLIITVAMHTDQRFHVVENLIGQSQNPDLHAKAIYIDVDDAECWVIAPGTIIGINAAGGLKRHAGGTVRNDLAYLRQIAAMAKAWYGKDRATATIVLQHLEPGYSPGLYLRNITDSFNGVAVNSIVTEKVYDLRAQTTTIQTAFEELNLQGRQNPRPGLGK